MSELPSPTTTVFDHPDDQIADLRAQTTNLRSIVTELERANVSLTEQLAIVRNTADQQEADFDIVCREMLAAADEYEMCSTFDTVVRQINTQLQVFQIPRRSVELVLNLRLQAPADLNWDALVSVAMDRAIANLVGVSADQIDTKSIDVEELDD